MTPAANSPLPRPAQAVSGPSALAASRPLDSRPLTTGAHPTLGSFDVDRQFPDMTYLFFDTETTGIPADHRAPPELLDNWPRVVQLAFLLTSATGTPISSKQFLIKPDGFVIPSSATIVHGITTEQAYLQGIPLLTALNEFLACLQSATTLVAHNLSYDQNVLGAEFLRCGLPNPLPRAGGICTMQSAMDFCAIPGRHGFKYPSLRELHAMLFHRDLVVTHSALADVRACADCFFALKSKGIISG
jgi:DNA polymerase III subunit epsilon